MACRTEARSLPGTGPIAEQPGCYQMRGVLWVTRPNAAPPHEAGKHSLRLIPAKNTGSIRVSGERRAGGAVQGVRQERATLETCTWQDSDPGKPAQPAGRA